MNTKSMIFSAPQTKDALASSKQAATLQSPVKSHHLSSFGSLNRNGLEIAPGISLPESPEEKNKPGNEFSAWLPLQEQWGYIPMRKFDFW